MGKRRKAAQPRPVNSKLTWALALAVCLMTGVLVATVRGPDVPASRAPRLARVEPPSDKIHFDRISLDDRKSSTRMANVQIVDLDRDGLNDILVCDTARNSVILYRQTREGRFEERVLADHLKCPAHATVVDIDQDGDLDIVVSVLGSIFPWDELVGQVVLLENDGGKFVRHLLLDDVRRVADVQAGDFNRDGKIDLAVAVFGYARGEVLWLENRGKSEGQWHFRDHQLLDRPGSIHVPVGDFDGDGDLDICAVVSQDEEELWGFENLGNGEFKSRLLYSTANYDVGSAGLVACDLDRDGKLDFLLPQGDNLEDPYTWPQPYHGCLWLRNKGNWQFEKKQIASFGGTYAAAAADLDGDGDMDVVLVSLSNQNNRNHPSLVWLENNGHQEFTLHQIDALPLALVTVACGDLNRDGLPDIVAASLVLPPIMEKNVDRLPIWMSRRK